MHTEIRRDERIREKAKDQLKWASDFLFSMFEALASGLCFLNYVGPWFVSHKTLTGTCANTRTRLCSFWTTYRNLIFPAGLRSRGLLVSVLEGLHIPLPPDVVSSSSPLSPSVVRLTISPVSKPTHNCDHGCTTDKQRSSLTKSELGFYRSRPGTVSQVWPEPYTLRNRATCTWTYTRTHTHMRCALNVCQRKTLARKCALCLLWRCDKVRSVQTRVEREKDSGEENMRSIGANETELILFTVLHGQAIMTDLPTDAETETECCCGLVLASPIGMTSCNGLDNACLVSRLACIAHWQNPLSLRDLQNCLVARCMHKWYR